MEFLSFLAAATTGPATTQAVQAVQAAAAAATTQAAGAPAVPNWWELGLIGWYIEGGTFMVPLFICQVIGLGVIIERWLTLKSIRIDVASFRQRVKELLSQSQIKEAIDFCDTTPGPVAATVAVGLRRFILLEKLGKPMGEVEAEVGKAIDDYGTHIMANLEKHLWIIASVTALAPLFGFLGTVDGMRIAFGDIERSAGTGNTILLTAMGIKIALYTTILGLVLAIPNQLAYNLFTNRISSIVLDIEESATELIQDLALLTTVGGGAIKAPAESPKA